MSSSIISSLALHCAGRLARRSKPHQCVGFRKSLSNYSSYGRSSTRSVLLPDVSSKSPHTLVETRLGHRTHANIEMFYCRQVSTLLCLDTGPRASFIEPGRSTKILLLHDLNTLSILNAKPPLLSGIPVAQQVQFISSQRRSSKNTEVFTKREAQSLGRNVRNSRGNSEKAGDRSMATENKGEASLPENPEEDEKKLTLYQRFKKTYKEHGKVLVAVHVATSIVWFSTFYTAATLGFDIVPLLESWNLSERVISPFRSGGLGNVALAYLLYKLATPARYTVTIAGTRYAIGYLQKEGRMKVVPKSDSLRSLYKEGKEDIKGRSKRRMTIIRRKAGARRKQRSSSEEISNKP